MVATAAVVIAGTVTLAGCGATQTAQKACEDTATQVRVADSDCQATPPLPHVAWIYFISGQRAPMLGGKVFGGSRIAPPHAVVEEAPAHGGVVDAPPVEPHVNAPVEPHVTVVDPVVR